MDMTDQGIRRWLIEHVWTELQKLYAVPFERRDMNWYVATTYGLRQLAMIEAT